MKKCSKCQTFLSYDKFNKGSNAGYSSYCKLCQSEYYHQTWGANKKKKIKTEISRQCYRCKQMFPNNEFREGNHRLTSYCKKCKSDIGRSYNIARFGLTIEMYVDLEREQGGVCKICKQADTKRLSVDHDHKCCSGVLSCGKCIRGLLCSRCNKTLGMVQDNIEYLQNMIKYLQQ